MYLETRAFSQQEWAALAAGFPDLSLVQTWEYAQAKAQTASWDVVRMVFTEGAQVRGAAQALVRRLPWFGGGLVWINRGPLWRSARGDGISSLVGILEALRTYWVEEQRMYLRVAPPVTEGELELRTLERIGYTGATGLIGWSSARLDLSTPLETIRRRLQQKWRNCLNKAERLGLTVLSGSDEPLFARLLQSYTELLRRRRYQVTVTPRLLTHLQAVLPSDRKLWSLIAMQGDLLLGGVLIARYGDTCEYLVGAVNQAGRVANAGYLLLWQSVCEMQSLGYRWFDLGGMDPDRSPPGIYHFKSGLSAAPYRYVGEFESVDRRWINRAVRWRVGRARKSGEV